MDSIENDVVTYLTNKINLKKGFRIIWLEGLGHYGSGLSGLLERITIKAVSSIIKPRYTIRLSMSSIVDQMCRLKKNVYEDDERRKISYQLTVNEAGFEMETYIAIAIANALGIMDANNEKFKKLKDELDEELLYNYEVNKQKESNLVDKLVVEIYEKLRNTNYLLVIECIGIDLFDPAVLDRAMKWLLKEGCLPEPSKWNGARWVISKVPDYMKKISYWGNRDQWKLSNFIFDKYKDEDRDVELNLKDLIREKDWPLQSNSKQQLVELALQFCAQSVAPAVRVREPMDILRSCLLYSLLFSPEINDEISSVINNYRGYIAIADSLKLKLEETEEEKFFSRVVNRIIGHKADLVNFWVAEGLLGDEKEGEGEINFFFEKKEKSI